MANVALCRWCGRSGHLVDDCPDMVKKVVTNKASVTNVINKGVTNEEVSKGEVERVLAWREKNKEKYKEYQREYMRKRRNDKQGVTGDIGVS